ncbi:putative TPR repeat methyltransferase [Azospirillum fermentarium]|uniref:class I SAM-dependent DNA methyltransferase n=1 Tax=Azospirillum fermentarium TaxID=1233114 RepID=UPI002227E9E4|nr:methyltransferase [Azospirillum fermentarium]MCW2247894.1 putative TPR repeat methyltransferase [Azospirillum fermentarium]
MTEPSLPRRPSRLARPSAGGDAGLLNERAIRTAAAGDAGGAACLLRAALACDPTHGEAWTNLGKLLADGGEGAAGAAGHARALRLGLWHPLVLFNLGVARRQAGDRAGAATAFRAAAVMAPDHGDALNSLGNLAEPPGAAVALYLRALRVQPGLGIVHGNLAGALYRLHQSGGAAEAARAAALWLAAFPDDPTARHIAPALIRGDGGAAETRASDAYVRTTFDQFADAFEDTLTALGYCAPQRLAEAMAAEGVEPESGLSVLDAGCGTGLCAPFLRPAALWLEGVDLSGGMLEQARARGLYDRLTEAELTAFLTRHPARFDVILAADVLCYFGDLAEVLAAARAGLRPGGLLAFTVERLADGRPYRVNPHGRYAHAPGYVEAAVEGAGLRLSVLRGEVLRHEGGQPVAGLLVTARHR